MEPTLVDIVDAEWANSKLEDPEIQITEPEEEDRKWNQVDLPN